MALPFQEQDAWSAFEEAHYDTHIKSPFVPSPEALVLRAAALAEIGAGDTVVDLGCGAGDVCLALARHTGCRALGIDINPHLIDAATEAASVPSAAAFGPRCRFLVGDLTQAATYDDIIARDARATVLYLYILPRFMEENMAHLLRLRSRLQGRNMNTCSSVGEESTQTVEGAAASEAPPPPFRIVSMRFEIPGWEPTAIDETGEFRIFLYR